MEYTAWAKSLGVEDSARLDQASFRSLLSAHPLLSKLGGGDRQAAAAELETSVLESGWRSARAASANMNMNMDQSAPNVVQAKPLPPNHPSKVNTRGLPYLVKVDRDLLGVRYAGKGNHAYDVGTARADKPVPEEAEVSYRAIDVSSIRALIIHAYVRSHTPMHRTRMTADTCTPDARTRAPMYRCTSSR